MSSPLDDRNKDVEVAPGIYQTEEDYRANMDYDAVKDQQAEDRAYRAWEREQKNRILSMTDTNRKQAAWRNLFPQMEHGDDWMLTANVF